MLWVDLSQEPTESCEHILRTIFGFHPLAVEDALHESHVPKINDWGDYLQVVLHGLTFDRRGNPALATRELDVFLGPNYVVTHHAESIPTLERLSSICTRDERNLRQGPTYFLYRLCDEMSADYMTVVDQLDDEVEALEDAIFDGAGPRLVQDIFQFKRALIALRRVVAPTREVVNKLARGDYAVVDGERRVFFRDVYDQLVRMHDLTEGLRDVVGGAVDTYLSVVNNRMNEIMKTLTVITTLFMPLSFVVGFFGMNFFQPAAPLPNWTSLPAFVATLAAIVAIPLGMYLWMRRRAWM
jgi:magnesium transporter